MHYYLIYTDLCSKLAGKRPNCRDATSDLRLLTASEKTDTSAKQRLGRTIVLTTLYNTNLVGGFNPSEKYGCFQKWGYPQLSSISMGFSVINHPFGATPSYGNLHITPLGILFPILIYGKNRKDLRNHQPEISTVDENICFNHV